MIALRIHVPFSPFAKRLPYFHSLLSGNSPIFVPRAGQFRTGHLDGPPESCAPLAPTWFMAQAVTQTSPSKVGFGARLSAVCAIPAPPHAGDDTVSSDGEHVLRLQAMVPFCFFFSGISGSRLRTRKNVQLTLEVWFVDTLGKGARSWFSCGQSSNLVGSNGSIFRGPRCSARLN